MVDPALSEVPELHEQNAQAWSDVEYDFQSELVPNLWYLFHLSIHLLACSLIVKLMDPWGCEVESAVVVSKFEDDFTASRQDFEKLSDSAEYLAVLERKLKAVRSKNKVVENLSAYRADCINRLMRDGCDLDPVIGDTEAEKLLQDKEN
ncbi:hypothetical protein evm_007331 [Chilo suppressalis]|nr:hypothetical protein evm_007331 [Chilo suppressalis]